MLSALAHMAAISEVTFAAGFAPPLLSAPSNRIAAAASSESPARSARHITRTSPASANRFGSSNAADTARGGMEECIPEMHLRTGRVEA
jgi:hypothetical protein